MKLLKKYDHPIKIYRCFNRLPLSFDLLYYTILGKEYELEMDGCSPIATPEEAYVSLESLGIEIE